MKSFLLAILLIQVFGAVTAQETTIIPKPMKVVISEGKPGFAINKNTVIVTDITFYSEAAILATYLNKLAGIVIPVKRGNVKLSSLKTIILLKQDISDEIPKEGYLMGVSGKEIKIRASHSAGAYYGCMSLLQAVVHSGGPNRFVVPAMQIKDHPRFAWRGLMLDCSRTFLSIDFLKRMINRMSFYKLNTLHLHLTDDQGWRLQIKKYPLLTTKGAYFVSWYHEPKEFQGFYTQAQMKELVAYAQKRHITIVPEIECPGHSHAALYAYPELSCGDRDSTHITPIFPFMSPNWDEAHKVGAVNPCKKSTYLFYKEVIREVANIFPSPYIHLGGDEVHKDAWKNCARCKTMADSFGIPDDTKHLQKIIMDSVGKYVSEEGRRPIGWDEVFYEGVKKNYIIQLWRSDQSVEEAKAGYDLIVSPSTYLYFDHSYEMTPTKKVFLFQPIPDSATNEEKGHYLGIEACFWSHIDRTESKIDYQIFPRLLALSERAWSAKNDTSYNDFYQREIKQQTWLNYFKIVYNKNHF